MIGITSAGRNRPYDYFVGECGVWVHNSGDEICMGLASGFYNKYLDAQKRGVDFDFDAGFADLRRQLDDLVAKEGISSAGRDKHLRDAIKDIKKKAPEWEVPLVPTVVKDDALDRIQSAETFVKLENLYAGTGTTKAARGLTQTGDDAGHIFAMSLGGKGGKTSDNIFSQLRGINRGDYRDIEQDMLDAVLEGKEVKVRVEFHYEGTDLRPDNYEFIYEIDGVKDSEWFYN